MSLKVHLKTKFSISYLLAFAVSASSTFLTGVVLASDAKTELSPAIIKQLSTYPINDASTIKQQAQSRTSAASQSELVEEHYLVEFHDAPVAKHLAQQSQSAVGDKNRVSLKDTSATRIQKQIETQQTQILSTLTQDVSGLEVLTRHNTLFNGAQVKVAASELQKLKSNPAVKAVYPVRRRFLNLDASHQVTQAVEAWEALGGQSEAGRGIKIAVVDTGIRNENPMFNDDGYEPVDLSGNSHLTENPDYCRSPGGDAGFCNNKLIVARYMDPAQHNMEIYSGEYLSPKGFDGHGTHVAGIAAGNPVNIEFNHTNIEVSGSAPGAYLMVYKALYMSPFGTSFGTDTMLLEALEMAVLDGADVINNSWGAGSGEDPDASIYNAVFENAEAMGIVVVNAAGNTGHPGATINCPACIESGIAVANTTHGRFFGNQVEVNGKSFLAYQGQNNQIDEPLELKLMSLNSLVPLDDSGCAPMSGDFFAGAIVLVDYRPFCTVETVAQNIRDAGGEAVLIYQAGAFGMGTYEPFVVFEGDYVIPTFGLSRESGLQIVDDAYLAQHTLTISEQFEQGIEQQYIDIVNPFSSTGPNNNPSVLKPDISAPGTNVLSAYSPDEFQFGGFPDGPGFPGGPGDAPLPDSSQDSDPVFSLLTGTSMASPQIAGAAALLRQQYPDWTPKQIKAALMSTSNPDILIGAGAANAFQQGAGRVNMHDAMTATLGFSESSWSEPACIGTCSLQNTLVNYSDEAQEWYLEVSFFDGETLAEVTPSSVSLAPAGEDADQTDITLLVDTSRTGPESERQSILFDKWVFGRLTATNAAGEVQHMPLVAFANDASDEGSLLVSYDGTNLQSNVSVPFQTRLRNKGAENTASARLVAPANTRFVAGSEAAELRNSETSTLQMSDDLSVIEWSGDMQQGTMSLQERSQWDDFTLASAEVPPLPCTDGCLGFTSLVEFDFQYNGDNYNLLTISDNGFVVPGAVNIGSFVALFNQRFPLADSLNNVIAPFWTEFDLLDPNFPGDTGGGYVRAAVRVIDEINYLVVEWDSVQPFDINGGDEGEIPPEDELPPEDEVLSGEGEASANSADSYTFQLIIQENTDNIWFNYLNIPAVPDFLSIGAENTDGSIGLSYYFDGEGNIINGITPETGFTLQLGTAPEGQVLINSELELIDGQDYAVDDTAEGAEDTVIQIDVLQNDITQTAVTLVSEMEQSIVHKAIATAFVQANGGLDTSTLEIVSDASNGSVTVDNGALVYTPEANFSGNDQFTYRVADGAGIYSVPANVRVSVAPVNDPPVLSPFTSVSVQEGETVVIVPEATDVDGDPLTFSISQTQGIIVPVTSNGQQFEFTAPEVDGDLQMTFTVVASDAQLESAGQSVSVTVTDTPSSSGGSTYYLLSFIILAFYRRYFEARIQRAKPQKV